MVSSDILLILIPAFYCPSRLCYVCEPTATRAISPINVRARVYRYSFQVLLVILTLFMVDNIRV